MFQRIVGAFVETALLGVFLCASAAAAEGFSTPVEISSTYRAGDVFMGIRQLGSVRLLRTEVDGLPIRELSGLAWDDDAGLLYAVSDNGHVVHLKPVFAGGRLQEVVLLAAYPLRDETGNALAEPDSEGLDIVDARNGIAGDARLIISFEQRPRVMSFKPDGTLVDQYPLPSPLADGAGYQHVNKGLEGVAWHPRYGIITGAEKPLRDQVSGLFTVYSLQGDSWSYSPYDAEYGALVGLEVTDDGGLLVLERNYRSMLAPVVFALRKVHLDGAPASGPMLVEDVALFNNKEGWEIDNFESLAKHRGDRFFMMSDDNDSSLQRTLLVYFELLGATELVNAHSPQEPGS